MAGGRGSEEPGVPATSNKQNHMERFRYTFILIPPMAGGREPEVSSVPVY